MKLKFVVTLSLTLGSFNVGSFAVDVARKLETENHQRTQFADLDEDCVFLILEYLDFVNLLNVAQINAEFSTLAANVYRRKYSRLSVLVKADFPFTEEQNELLEGMDIDNDLIKRLSKDRSHLLDGEPEVDEYDNEIALNDCYSILNSFKHFGHEIKNLVIEIDPPKGTSWDTELIGFLISEFSSESLVDISFRIEAEELLNHITKSLINVENVTFACALPTFGNPNIAFIDLFPAVRRLYLHEISADNSDSIDCHMLNLEHVFLKLSDKSFEIPKFIGKNQQIRSIHLSGVDAEFLRELNTLLPRLETLKLRETYLTDESIQFEQVTSFAAEFISPQNLHFPRLQNLHISGTNLIVDKFLVFLNEHNQLSHLHLEGYEMNDSQFQQLTANLNDLTEISLEHEDNLDKIQELSTNAAVEFLRSHHTVEQINVINFSERWTAEIQEQLRREWNMKPIENGMSFERI